MNLRLEFNHVLAKKCFQLDVKSRIRITWCCKYPNNMTRAMEEDSSLGMETQNYAWQHWQRNKVPISGKRSL